MRAQFRRRLGLDRHSQAEKEEAKHARWPAAILARAGLPTIAGASLAVPTVGEATVGHFGSTAISIELDEPPRGAITMRGA